MERTLYSYRINVCKEDGTVTIEQEDFAGNQADRVCLHIDQIEIFIQDLNHEVKG